MDGSFSMLMLVRSFFVIAVGALLLLAGCAESGGDQTPARQTSVIPPQPAERSEPAGTAVVAALDALAVGGEAFGPPQDRRSQPPTDEAFRAAASSEAR